MSAETETETHGAAFYQGSNLLEPEQRIGCLKQIAAHLAPRGLAVLHLPAAELLCSEVPQAEIDKMRLQHKVATGIGPDLLLAQFVSAIQYDPLLKSRSIAMHAALADTEGNPTSTTSARCTMRASALKSRAVKRQRRGWR